MKKLLILPLLCLYLTGNATNYYVKKGGSDSANGLSDATAWATTAKVNSSMSMFRPGDSILFRRGDSWTSSTINIGIAGSLGKNIVISSYGSGAKPIISASPNSAAITVTAANRGYWTIDNLDLRATGTPSGIYSSLAIYHGYWQSDLGPVPNWIVQNCSFNACVMLSGPNTVVRNNTFNGAGNSYNRGGGITFRGPECDNVIIENNEVSNYIGRGIWIYNGGSDPVIRHNYVHDITGNDDNSGTGINVDGYGVRVTGGKVYNNRVVNVMASGIAFENGYNAEVYNNRTENCGWGGFMIWQYSQYMGVDCNVNIHHNIVRNGENGVVIYGAAGATIANNTFIKDNASVKNEGAFFVASSSSTVARIRLVNNIITGNWAHPVKVPDTKNIWTEFDYNLIPGSEVISRGGTNLSWSQIQALGFMTHGVNADPKFAGHPSDLHLLSGSPAINAGTAMSYTHDFDGKAISGTPDIGAFEYSGAVTTPEVVTPAYVSSVIQDAARSIIEVTYSAALANIVPAASAFSVKINSSDRGIRSVAVSGTKVSISLLAPAAYGDVITISYTKPASAPLQTISGGQAASITNRPVTNNIKAPAPQFVGAIVRNSSPEIIETSFDIPLASIIPASSAFQIKVNAVIQTISKVSVSGTKVLLSLAGPVKTGDTITLSYNKPSINQLQGAAGTHVESFASRTVTNSVEAVVENPSTPPDTTVIVNDGKIAITPHPAKDNISIVNFNPGNEVSALRISDHSGKLLLEYKLTDAESMKSIPLTLNPGFYMAKIIRGVAEVYVQKLIVVKR